MAYKAMQLLSDEIPVNGSGSSMGESHKLYKNAVVYVEASMSNTQIFSDYTYIYVYTYGRGSDGYLNKSYNGYIV